VSTLPHESNVDCSQTTLSVTTGGQRRSQINLHLTTGQEDREQQHNNKKREQEHRTESETWERVENGNKKTKKNKPGKKNY
jgi:hypothetical protein